MPSLCYFFYFLGFITWGTDFIRKINFLFFNVWILHYLCSLMPWRSEFLTTLSELLPFIFGRALCLLIIHFVLLEISLVAVLDFPIIILSNNRVLSFNLINLLIFRLLFPVLYFIRVMTFYCKHRKCSFKFLVLLCFTVASFSLAAKFGLHFSKR